MLKVDSEDDFKSSGIGSTMSHAKFPEWADPFPYWAESPSLNSWCPAPLARHSYHSSNGLVESTPHRAPSETAYDRFSRLFTGPSATRLSLGMPTTQGCTHLFYPFIGPSFM